MRTTEIQSNFTRGEVTPLLYGRVDQDIYKAGLKTAKNAVIHTQGPISRRNGTKYCNRTKNNTDVKLIPFTFTSSESYMLELGATYIRFYVDGAVQNYELVTPYSVTEVQDLDVEVSGPVIYLAHPDHPVATITRTGPGAFTFDTLFIKPVPTYEAGEDLNVTITPGATTGSGITFTLGAASAVASDIGRQIINLTGKGKAIITNTPSTSLYTVTIVENFPSTAPIAGHGWKLDLSPISTLTPSTIIKGAIATINADIDTWRNQDIGSFILLNNGIIQITGVSTPRIATGEVQKTLDNLTSNQLWTLEVPTWDSTRGYPRAICVYNQRLFLAGTYAEPTTIWASTPGDYSDFGIGANPGDSLSFILSRGSNITWMSASRNLIVGADIGESPVAFDPNTGVPSQSLGTTYGSNPQSPIQIEGQTIFLQRSSTKMFALNYQFVSDSYSAQDLSLISEHIFGVGVNSYAYAQNPIPTIYTIMSDGTMATTIYSVNPSVMGTTLYDTQGEFKQVSAVQNRNSYDVYTVVKRMVLGAAQYYIELFDHGTGEKSLDMFSDSTSTYVDKFAISAVSNANPAVVTTTLPHTFSNGDHVVITDMSGLTEIQDIEYTISNVGVNTFRLVDIKTGVTVDSSAMSAYVSGGTVYKKVLTVSGLGHLQGLTVQVKADNSVHRDLVVSGSAITLDYYAAMVTVGLSYETNIETLNKEFNVGLGQSMQGQRVRWIRPQVRIYKSTTPYLNGQFIPSRKGNDLMDMAEPLISGDIAFNSTGWDTEGNLTVSTTDPLPLTIVSIFGTIEGGLV